MILIDRRQGSGDLAKSWPESELADLRFGDVAILGVGPDGRGSTCGIELKKLTEIVGDITTGRFLGYQAPGLCRTYDTRWLVIEGEYSEGGDGDILVPRRSKATGQFSRGPIAYGGGPPVKAQTLMALICTLTQKAGIHVWMTRTPRQTLDFCKQLATWWLAGWDSHQSLETFYTPPSGLLQKEHSLLRLWLKELRGIGWKRSAEAEQQFDSAREMAISDWPAFAKVKGISESQAKKIVERIRA